VALDDVAGSHIIGKEHHFLAHGATRLLDLSDRPGAVLFARPEREPCSIGAVEGTPIRDPGRDLECPPSPLAECRWHPSPLDSQGFAALRSHQPEQALDLAPIKAHH
jgi:hypothetical protein